jgi:hypothetical protein
VQPRGANVTIVAKLTGASRALLPSWCQLHYHHYSQQKRCQDLSIITSRMHLENVHAGRLNFDATYFIA